MVNVGTARGTERSVFGDAALLLFLIVQACDGVLTYVGVTLYGPQMEGNPLLNWLMASIGHGPALATAKVAASGFGIALHLTAVHKAVAVLTVFYLMVAVVPWFIALFVWN